MKDKLDNYIRVFSYIYLALSLLIFAINYQNGEIAAFVGLAFAIIGFIGIYAFRKQVDRLVISYAKEKTEALDSNIKDSFKTFPVSIAVVSREDFKPRWVNEEFVANFDFKENFYDLPFYESIEALAQEKIKNYFVHFPCEIKVSDKIYRVFAKSEDKTKEFINMYFIDVTDDATIREEFENTRPMISIISIDNYEELLRNCTDTEKSMIIADINSKIDEWAKTSEGILRKIDRDRYIFIFNSVKLDDFIKEKFSILGEIRKVQTAEGITATLSIGIGTEGETLDSSFGFALNALEMALSRGGDQVVIKNKTSFEFYGGVSKEFEKRTKVKSRVIANAINQIIKESSDVYIMGHKVADYDALGAAIGISAAVKAQGKNFKIVMDLEKNSTKPLLERLLKNEAYKDAFIDPEQALIEIEPTSLLIVVDTNRPSYVESTAILEAATKVVLIDHHRRAADYIDNVAVSMHEPYASSTCEIVTELLQYMLSTTKITKTEAESLMAGIVLDTKNFSAKAGSRTFEAAAYLRRVGADVENVKMLFKNDFETQLIKNSIMSTAKEYSEKYIIATTSKETERAIASQCADELLNVLDIWATFVIFKNENSVIITARSNSRINVQVIMEKMGGGGSINAAACSFEGDTTDNVERMLREVVDRYENDELLTENPKTTNY